MNAAIETPVFAPRASDRCPLCALVGALAAALVLAVLAKGVFLVPHGPTHLALDETCSLSSETCALSLPDGGRLEFALGPRPVRLLSPLKLEIRVSGSDARPLEVDFTGVNTPMAFNRAYLIPSGNGVYGAQTGLPVCATGRMVWQATVLLENGERRMLAPFHFETQR
ncbi:MAG: hypothetical protein ACK4ZS_04220 [Sulfurimicrobium sp.]